MDVSCFSRRAYWTWLNPARDFAPRLVHALLPLKHKGSSQWGYAWVPVVAPICAGIVAVLIQILIYGLIYQKNLESLRFQVFLFGEKFDFCPLLTYVILCKERKINCRLYYLFYKWRNSYALRNRASASISIYLLFLYH